MNKIVTVTLFCKINNNTIVINNGMSFGIDLLGAEKNIFFSIDGSIDKLKNYLRSYKRIYISIFSAMELKFIKPILDKRWVVGGPITQNKNINIPCEITNKTIPEYLGIKDYKFNNFSTYFENLMRMYPKHTGSITASIGCNCYWGKCKFCSFVNKKRKMIMGNDIQRILDKINTLKGKYLTSLAIPGIFPNQLKTVLEHKMDRNKFLHVYIIPIKEISNVLEKFDSKEMKNIIADVGLESMNDINRLILNKGTNSNDIIECIGHIIRLDGVVELPLMSGYFNTTKESVKQTKLFLKKLESIVPKKKIYNLSYNDDLYIRWPLTQRKYLELLTTFPIVEYKENLRSYLKVEIPTSSKVYKYNNQIKEIIQGSYLCTGINEKPSNILDKEYNS